MRKKKNIDTKIDELAQMVASGFSEVHDDIRRIESKVEDMSENYATREDLVRLRSDVDIMLDRPLAPFGKIMTISRGA